MQCLMDSDILLYEIGFGSETAWKGWNPDCDKEWLKANPPPFDVVEEMLLNRIMHIETMCAATEPSIYFFTGKTNFRNLIAKKKPYKERAGNKPFHYYNIKAYIQGRYDWRQEEGLEADDLLAIYQTARIREESTIICSRDKDLFTVNGNLFSWELGNSPQIGPAYFSGYGNITLSQDRKKLKGYGHKFFLAQCITGDTVDSIPGIPGKGLVAAFELLSDTDVYMEGLQRVIDMYETVYGDEWGNELLEQGQLLWMTRHINEDGSPELWNHNEDFTRKIETVYSVQP